MRRHHPFKQRCATRPAGLRGVVALLVLGVALICMPAAANEPGPAERVEYQVKAGFLANFGKLTEWPKEAERATNAFRIGVMDDGAAFELIKEALAGKEIKGRKVEVHRFDEDTEPGGFEIVFVTRSQGGKWKEVVRRVGDQPVLTVGESEGFAKSGGRINFVLKEQKVRFEVNLESANGAGLRISSKVAAMATVVSGKEARP
jgi:hypothetical protein